RKHASTGRSGVSRIPDLAPGDRLNPAESYLLLADHRTQPSHDARSGSPTAAASSPRANAQNSVTESSSARAVGTIPAPASSGSAGIPSDLRLDRSILRRCPNAAAVTRSSVGLSAGDSGTGRGVNRTTLDVTFGAGVKARGGMSNRIF